MAMDNKEKLKRAMLYASRNPKSQFAIELRKRIESGEYNSILEESGIGTEKFGKKQGKNWLKELGGAIIKSETEFGKSLAGAADIFSGGVLGGGKRFEETQSLEANTTRDILRAIRDKEARGEDTSKLRNILMSGNQNVRNALLERQADLTVGKVAGQAVGVAADIIGGGTIGNVGARTVTAPTTILSGALRGAGQGAVTGAGFGAVQGGARAAQEGGNTQDVITQGVSGGIVGGVAGGLLGGITGGVSGGLRGAALRKQQLQQELTSNPDLVARYNIDDLGNIRKDKVASEALKQGIPESQVAVVKNATPTDKSKFARMFDLAESAQKNAKQVDRPSDIVGETIVERTRHLVSQARQAGQKVDEAALALKGQTVDPSEPITRFINDLNEIGVQFKNGKPVFDGSEIEGIAPAEKLIKNVVRRAEQVSDDAFELRKLIKFIDEQVTFGKQTEGLTGQTEFILKTLRRNLDNVLDTNFPTYNTANQGYAVARELLDATRTVLGKNFNPADGKVRAGSIARRILGNSANRGDILEYLQSLEQFYKATGGQSSDDVIAQTVFADILEDIFGTQATTGLQGQFQRGVEQAGGVVQDIGQGQLITGLTRGAVRLFQATRGVTDEAKISALRALLR